MDREKSGHGAETCRTIKQSCDAQIKKAADQITFTNDQKHAYSTESHSKSCNGDKNDNAIDVLVEPSGRRNSCVLFIKKGADE